MTAMSTPTPRELEILKVLWEQGPSSVRDVHRLLSRDGELAYNTVQTLLRIMEERKGLVEHHVDEEENVIFPLAREQLTAAEAERLAGAMQQEKSRLIA